MKTKINDFFIDNNRKLSIKFPITEISGSVMDDPPGGEVNEEIILLPGNLEEKKDKKK